MPGRCAIATCAAARLDNCGMPQNLCPAAGTSKATTQIRKAACDLSELDTPAECRTGQTSKAADAAQGSSIPGWEVNCLQAGL